MINKPHRDGRAATHPGSTGSRPRTAARVPSPDDGVLETDSEDDEFAHGFELDMEDGDIVSSDAEEEAPDSPRELADGEGVGLWQPDDWDGEDDESGEEDEEDEEGAVRNDRSESMRLVCRLSPVGLTVLIWTALFQRRLQDGEMT